MWLTRQFDIPWYCSWWYKRLVVWVADETGGIYEGQYWEDVQKKLGKRYKEQFLSWKSSFKADLRETLCPHVYNIRHQFKSYRELKENLGENEAILHIDFSENWLCKYTKQIQSAHFGDSNKQATLHTGMCYLAQKLSSFCTISDSRRHDPVAICAHLAPVLRKLRDKHESVNVVHFFSDGPTTQYRNRTNLYLFSTLLFEYGFQGGTWNYFESGMEKMQRMLLVALSKGKRMLWLH